MEHTYKRPMRKLYRPVGLDRFDAKHDIPPGTVVLVTASWGPFRGIVTLDGRTHGSCGKGSLVPVPRPVHRCVRCSGVLPASGYCPFHGRGGRGAATATF
jgi:hypothetical protein